MAYKNLIYKQEEGLSVITINRPKSYNALNSALIMELNEICDILENSPDVRVVIITGGGKKAFAAGADIYELMEANTLAAFENCNTAHEVYNRFESLPYPTIAAINGPALGGGLELALTCDFRISGEDAIFGLPEITLGIIPGAGGTQRLTKLVGTSHAKEMIFLGTRIKAQKTLEIGW